MLLEGLLIGESRPNREKGLIELTRLKKFNEAANFKLRSAKRSPPLVRLALTPGLSPIAWAAQAAGIDSGTPVWPRSSGGTACAGEVERNCDRLRAVLADRVAIQFGRLKN